jgi:hypothetical protein
VTTTWQPGDPLYDRATHWGYMIELIDDEPTDAKWMAWAPSRWIEPGPWTWLQPGRVLERVG